MQRDHNGTFSLSNIFKTVLFLLFAAAILLLWGDILLDVVRIFFGAGLISFLLLPLAKFYERKIKRPVAALLALFTAIVALVLGIWLLLPSLARQFTNLSQTLPDAISRVQGILEGIANWIKSLFSNFTLPELGSLLPSGDFSAIAQRTVNYAGSVAGSLYQLSLMLVLSYFLMADRDRFLLRMELAIPAKIRRMAVRMGNGIVRELKLYIRGQAIIALCVGVLAGIGLMIVGVPGALLLGGIVGVFNMIPYLGPFLGSIPAVLSALSASWKHAAFSIVVLFLVQQIDSLVISPRIMGSITGFSPPVVLIALFVGSRINGIWGMLFAMPLLMSIRTVYRVFVQRHENN